MFDFGIVRVKVWSRTLHIWMRGERRHRPMRVSAWYWQPWTEWMFD